MAINYKKCPKCGSKNSGKILYGEPTYEAFQESEKGIIKLGGCMIYDDSPEYFCRDCQHEWNREQAISSAYSKIRAISAYVGGYFDGYYFATIDLKNLETTWRYSHDAPDKEIIKSIRSSTAEKFIEQLKITKILDWKAEYIDPDVRDGTQWGLEIITDEKALQIYGSNKFPKEWNLFCSCISKIIRKNFR